MHALAFVGRVALFVAGQISVFLATFQRMELQHEVNTRLPLDQQFEPTFWSFMTRVSRTAEKGTVRQSPHTKGKVVYESNGTLFFALGISILYVTLRR
jgi:hypothetical protein